MQAKAKVNKQKLKKHRKLNKHKNLTKKKQELDKEMTQKITKLGPYGT